MIGKLFTWPIRGVIALAEKIETEAERELYDLSSIQKQIVELYAQYDAGALSETEFDEREEQLLERYEMARQRKLHSSETPDDLGPLSGGGTNE